MIEGFVMDSNYSQAFLNSGSQKTPTCRPKFQNFQVLKFFQILEQYLPYNPWPLQQIHMCHLIKKWTEINFSIISRHLSSPLFENPT